MWREQADRPDPRLLERDPSRHGSLPAPVAGCPADSVDLGLVVRRGTHRRRALVRPDLVALATTTLVSLRQVTYRFTTIDMRSALRNGQRRLTSVRVLFIQRGKSKQTVGSVSFGPEGAVRR